jgi:GNAT superfamily N-acetyltransferase
MQIAACDPGSADACVLLDELAAALADLTGATGNASFAPDDVRAERAVFVIARDGDALLGCAALRSLEGDAGEIKRMYARPGTRGVGSALLAHIEQAALAFGYQRLCLETRRVNLRAVAFYERHGYTVIPNYGRYIGRPEAICLALALARDRTGDGNFL